MLLENLGNQFRLEFFLLLLGYEPDQFLDAFTF